jgi:heme-binding NEAT domain protein
MKHEITQMLKQGSGAIAYKVFKRGEASEAVAQSYQKDRR